MEKNNMSWVRIKPGISERQLSMYCKDTEPLHCSFMYSLVSLLSGIYPLPAMHSLLVKLYLTKYLIGINSPYKRDFVTLNKAGVHITYFTCKPLQAYTMPRHKFI